MSRLIGCEKWKAKHGQSLVVDGCGIENASNIRTEKDGLLKTILPVIEEFGNPASKLNHSFGILMMDDKEKNTVKSFKEMLKDRVSLVKQKSTELLLNSRMHNLKQNYEKNMQVFVDTLIPEMNQENEIQQALQEYVTNSRVKEVSQERAQKSKLSYDFFSSTGETAQISHKGTNNADKIHTSDLTPDPNENDKKLSPTKIGLTYFDLELNKPQLVSSSVISKINYDEAKHLFWDGQSQPVHSSSNAECVEDGLVHNPHPQSNSSHIKAILSCAVDNSDWFNSDGELATITLDGFSKMKQNDFRLIPKHLTEVETIFVESELTTHRNNSFNAEAGGGAISNQRKLLEIDLISIKFDHHHLFSLEHILASNLIQNYNLYKMCQSDITLDELRQNMGALRSSLEITKSEILKSNNFNNKKMYQNTTVQGMIKELSAVRKKHTRELLKRRELENSVLKYWRCIKYVRKQLKSTSTDLVLEVITKKTDIDADQKEWDAMFDTEVTNAIDQLKFEYLEKKSQYNKAKNEPDSGKELAKPVLNIDEEKVKRRIFNEMCEALRQPGDPIVLLNLLQNPQIIGNPTHKHEIKRRADVDRTKVILKIKINNQDVCKTKPAPLTQQFVGDFKSSYSIEVPENAEHLDILIFEQKSLLNPNLIANFKMELPDKFTTIEKDYTFESESHNPDHSHFGVGNCESVSEMINKKLKEFKLGNMDVDAVLKHKGTLTVKLGWNSKPSNNLKSLMSSESTKHKKPTKSTLVKLFEECIDPNDPKHMFLNTFFKNFGEKDICSKNFYINDYFNFNLDKTESAIEIVNLRNSRFQTVRDTDNVSGDIPKSYRQSVLDDISMSSKILDPIEMQTRMSVRYLELISEFIRMHSDRDKEKHQRDILTFVEYHTIRNIRMDFLRPRQPLFYPSHSKQSSVSIKGFLEHAKELSLKVCVLKAFQLPQRIDDNNTEENGGLKMINLRPFVKVSCQGTNLRTFTTVGSNPTWNQQLFFTVKNENSTEVTVNLFDEIYEDLLEDDRLEISTVHGQYNAKWLASLRIPLQNILTQPKLEGNFLMYSPPEILGYKQSADEHFSMMADGLRREPSGKLKGGFYISLLLETNPNCKTEQDMPREMLESNEMEYMIRYLNTFVDMYRTQYPNRNIELLVLDKSGKFICITRLFKALPLPDFADCIRNFSNVNYGSEHSSRSSTPKKRKKNVDSEDVTSQSIKSLLSGGETGRQSKGTKDNFDLRSVNVGEGSEKELPLKVNACARFVSLIPLFEHATNCSIALSGHQILHLACGSTLDHVTLLMSYFLQLGLECWCASGFSLSKGYSHFVLIKEKPNNSDVVSKNGRMSLSSSRNSSYYVYDAIAGIKYNVKDPFCPLQKIYSLCNNENVWVNIQASDRSSLVKFNLSDSSEWRPVFQKQIMACPAPLPVTTPDDKLYTYVSLDVGRLREVIEDKLKRKIQSWRGHRKTIWNRHCSSILRESLINWEKWCLNPSSSKPKLHRKLQQLMMSYEIYGFPYNTMYTSMRDITSGVKRTQIHLDEHSHVEYALAVDVFPYPNRIYSVWTYVCTLVKKVET